MNNKLEEQFRDKLTGEFGQFDSKYYVKRLSANQKDKFVRAMKIIFNDENLKVDFDRTRINLSNNKKLSYDDFMIFEDRDDVKHNKMYVDLMSTMGVYDYKLYAANYYITTVKFTNEVLKGIEKGDYEPNQNNVDWNHYNKFGKEMRKYTTDMYIKQQTFSLEEREERTY